jgi:hypothetical protein
MSDPGDPVDWYDLNMAERALLIAALCAFVPGDSELGPPTQALIERLRRPARLVTGRGLRPRDGDRISS